jgi:hypothetical protein
MKINNSYHLDPKFLVGFFFEPQQNCKKLVNSVACCSPCANINSTLPEVVFVPLSYYTAIVR